jgi:hypothetical protein
LRHHRGARRSPDSATTPIIEARARRLKSALPLVSGAKRLK